MRRVSILLAIITLSFGQSPGTNYQTPDGQFRSETIDGNGNVLGQYSYVNPDGKTITVKYSAGQNGFQVQGDHLPQPPQPPQPQVPQTNSLGAQQFPMQTNFDQQTATFRTNSPSQFNFNQQGASNFPNNFPLQSDFNQQRLPNFAEGFPTASNFNQQSSLFSAQSQFTPFPQQAASPQQSALFRQANLPQQSQAPATFPAQSSPASSQPNDASYQFQFSFP